MFSINRKNILFPFYFSNSLYYYEVYNKSVILWNIRLSFDSLFCWHLDATILWFWVMVNVKNNINFCHLIINRDYLSSVHIVSFRFSFHVSHVKENSIYLLVLFLWILKNLGTLQCLRSKTHFICAFTNFRVE